MFLSLAVFSVTAFLPDFKVIIRTIIIKDVIIALEDKVTVFINLRLDQVAVISQNG